MVSPSQNNDYHTVSKIFEAKCRQCNKWIIYQFNIPNPLISILFNLYVTKWHICRSCSRFLNFMWMETDAYTYMNLTGLPFCNSARNCQYIYSESNFFIGSQSPFRMYRISSNYFLITLVGVISYILMNLSIGNIGLLELILILYLSYAFCQIFIALHCDSAEGLSIIFLLEYVLSDQVYQNITRCPMKLKKDIQELQIQYMPKSRYQK